MTFADGLDYWELAGDFPGDGHPHWQDYSCTAADRSAVLASAVPEPPVSPSWSRRSTPTTTTAARSPSAANCAPPASPATLGCIWLPARRPDLPVLNCATAAAAA